MSFAKTIKKLDIEDSDKKLKIKKIVMMDEVYTDVETNLNAEMLKNAISDAKVIEIFEKGKSIFLNSTYIMSYEL